MSMNVMADSRWLVCTNPNPNAALRLFCIPYAGGNAAIYQHWHRGLPQDVEVFALQLPGRGNRLLEEPITDLEELTDSIIASIEPYLDKPYALFGHSMGAMISYEVACKLEERKLGELSHLFVSAFRAAHLPRRNTRRYMLSDAELKEELRRLNGTPEMLLQNDELMELFLPVIRADMQLCDTYEYRPKAPLSCGMTAFGGEADSGVKLDDIAAWKELTAGPFTFCVFPGDHFFVHSDEQMVLQAVKDQLNKLLNSGSYC